MLFFDLLCRKGILPVIMDKTAMTAAYYSVVKKRTGKELCFLAWLPSPCKCVNSVSCEEKEPLLTEVEAEVLFWQMQPASQGTHQLNMLSQMETSHLIAPDPLPP